MTDYLYLNDYYLQTSEAKVAEVRNGTGIILDRTCFYPGGGGQPCDFGAIACKGVDYAMGEVRKENGEALHIVDKPGLNVGEAVVLQIDWPRRYALMRMHTAAHVLGSVAFRSGALITGNQLGVEQSRFDFSFENFDRAAFDAVVEKANSFLSQPIGVKSYDLPREEALANPEMVKLAGALPPSIAILHIVEIPGVDIQADGGTHVRSLSEVGQIKLLKIENKGAKNKRAYFALA
ncbi:alanyl-tRNA editing protein [Candidatus Micrarchaeota archaeon]|nr:alanyl-tRNA editing protein [Candidatus Micrarchaeota archaeon]